MSATRDGKMWRCQFYYKDWQGVSHKKNKRGFKTKAEAEQWERDFLQQQQKDLNINFEKFVQIYYEVWNTVCVRIPCGQRNLSLI